MSVASGTLIDFFIVGRREDANDRFRLFNAWTSPSGAQNDANERSVNDPSGNYLIMQASGFSEVGVINVINNNIAGIASGVANLLRFDLPLNGDDDDVNHTTIFNIPVAEYTDAQKSEWNLKTPVGGVSGIVFDFSYFTENSETAAIGFDLSIRELPMGANIATITPITVTINESDTFTSDVIRNNEVKLGVSIPGLQDISLSFNRNADSLTGKVRVVSYGIIYKGSGLS